MATAPAFNTADYLVDRRRLRRKLLFWRVGGLVLLGVILVGIALRFAGGHAPSTLVPHIARVRISGLITGDEATLKLRRDGGAARAAAGGRERGGPGGAAGGA